MIQNTKDIFDWPDEELSAYLDLPPTINPPQLLASSKDIHHMEDTNLEALLTTAEFVLLFKSTLKGKGSKKTFWTKRLKKVNSIVNNTEKFKGFIPYLNYLSTLTKSDYQLSPFLTDCTECQYNLYQ